MGRCFWLVCLCALTAGCREREPDIIRSVVATPPTVRPGGSTVISVDANRKPSGAVASAGTIATPVSFLFVWVAPEEPGDYTITVRVGKATATITVPVRDLPDRQPPQPPPQVFARPRCIAFTNEEGETEHACTVLLEWLPATDDTGTIGYRLYRDGVLRWVAVGNQFIDQDVQFGRRYTYGVQAFDAAGNTSEVVQVQVRVK